MTRQTGFQASVGSTPSGVEEEEERKDVVPMVCNQVLSLPWIPSLSPATYRSIVFLFFLQYFNVHELLAQSILSCDYYLSLHDYKTFQEVAIFKIFIQNCFVHLSLFERLWMESPLRSDTCDPKWPAKVGFPRLLFAFCTNSS